MTRMGSIGITVGKYDIAIMEKKVEIYYKDSYLCRLVLLRWQASKNAS